MNNSKMSIMSFVLAIFVFFGVAGACSWINEARDVAQEEFGARGALDKYEWFKDASTQLDKKQADIAAYTSDIKNLESMYEGKSRTEWMREDRESHSQWTRELTGMITSYNLLVAQYNAASEKFNWAPFKDKSDNPPTQVKTYNTKGN